MIKLLLAVIIVAVILLLIGITVVGILEAKVMEWETRTIIRKEEQNDCEVQTINGRQEALSDDSDLPCKVDR